MKHDHKEKWWKRNMQQEEDGGISFHHIAMICLMFAGLMALALIGFSF